MQREQVQLFIYVADGAETKTSRVTQVFGFLRITATEDLCVPLRQWELITQEILSLQYHGIICLFRCETLLRISGAEKISLFRCETLLRVCAAEDRSLTKQSSAYRSRKIVSQRN